MSTGPRSTTESFSRQQTKLSLLIPAVITLFSLCSAPVLAQEGSSLVSACILKKGVYTCDGVSFQKILANAKTVSLETHTIDKIAQSQLGDFVTKKLGKTLVLEGNPTDLVFLLYPIEAEGVNYSSGDTDLGTLRIYLPNPQNAPGEIVWAEVFSGRVELPWASVVHPLILQFQARFHIK
jgi:hypothetical protein